MIREQEIIMNVKVRFLPVQHINYFYPNIPMKNFIAKKFKLYVIRLSLYSDRFDKGDVVTTGNDTFLILKENRRGFYTHYYSTAFKPSKIKLLDYFRKQFLKLLYKFDFFL